MSEKNLSPELLESVVAKAQAGDQASFTQIFDWYFDRIFRYTSFRVDDEACEDIVGDIFLKVVQNLGKYKPQPKSGFSAWIYRIAHNTIIDHYRKKKEITGYAEEDDDQDFWETLPDEINLLPDEEVHNRLQYKKLHKALKELKPIHREVLELRFLEGFSNKEVGQILGRTEGNIRILQLRGLREIRKFLEDKK